ncbi:MAG: DUF3772 domain-containing protein [Rhodobacteraceae bacterium]|nr:DUF3772 domain-containing protein [Paracoccaceae bacterium]
MARAASVAQRALSWLAMSALLLVLLLPGLAWAQEAGQGPDYENWRSVSVRAEEAIDADRASDAALESLRAEIATFRQQFLTARGANSARIATLESQLQALGPAPAEGESESESIAAQRTEIQENLGRLRAPGLVAEAAYNQADGLVRELDRILRDRKADALLSLGPTPLNPAFWVPAVVDFNTALRDIYNESRSNLRNPVTRQELSDDLPLVLFLVVLGLVLIVRGRRWAELLGNVLRRFGGRGFGVFEFVVSLGRIGVPLLGLLALTEAVDATGMVGVRGSFIVEMLPVWAAILLVARWLCERLFSRRDEDALIPLLADRRKEARLYCTVLAFLMVMHGAVDVLAGLVRMPEASQSVIVFPIVVLTGLVLFRLGQILRATPNPASDVEPAEAVPDDAARPTGMVRFVRIFGQAAMVISVVSPTMSTVGYGEASIALLNPMILTLGLFGIVLVLQKLVGDIYGALTGKGSAARDMLGPVLINFLLFLAAMPFLALLWGARVSDLTELWARFGEGFTLGGTRISLTDFLAVVVIFAIGYTATRLLQSALKTNLLPKTRIDPGGQTAIVSGIGYIGIFLAALIAITGAGIDLSALAFVAGALTVGIGFGLQNIVSNFVSGIILLIERPVSEGDWIEVGGNMGFVRNISVRSTRIETFDRSDVIVPNAELISGTVTNYTRGNTVGRIIVSVGVAYGTDTRRVEKILSEIALMHPMVLTVPPPMINFVGFGASSLDFEIRAILRDVLWSLSVKTELHHLIAERFAAEGIEIPFAQHDLWLRNPETLRADNRVPPAGDPDTA